MISALNPHVPAVIYATGAGSEDAKFGSVIRSRANALSPTVVVTLGSVMAGHFITTRPIDIEKLRESNPMDHPGMTAKLVVTWGPEDFVGLDTDKRKKQAWKDLLTAKALL